MKRIVSLITAVLFLVFAAVSVHAADTSYTVVKGDSMWKIAVKYQIGLDEITGNVTPSLVLQPDNQRHKLSASFVPHPTVFFLPG